MLPAYALVAGGAILVQMIDSANKRKRASEKQMQKRKKKRAARASKPGGANPANPMPPGAKAQAKTKADAAPKAKRTKAGKAQPPGLLETWKAMFSGERRDQLFLDMNAADGEKSPEQIASEAFFKRSLYLSGSMVTCSLLAPPLLLLHIPYMAYISIPQYKQGFADLKEKKITTVVLDTVLSIGSLLYTPFNLKILTVASLGNLSFAYTNKISADVKGRTQRHFTTLMGEQPKTVWRLVDDQEVNVPFNTIVVDDLVVIAAGDMIPLDGVITRGYATVDQRALTGEAQPSEKTAGDPVLAGTTIISGRIVVRVEKTGEETVAAQIGQMLMNTANFTSSVELRGKELSDSAAQPTLLLALGSLPFLGPNGSLSVLFSGVGYNMRMLGPLSVFNHLEIAAAKGILIKDGRALEQVAHLDTVVFDKTGTLTEEQPHVACIHTVEGVDADHLLTFAAAAESRQTHPIARALLEEAARRTLDLPPIDDVTYEVGYGIKVVLEGVCVRVGSNRYMDLEGIEIPEDISKLTAEAYLHGNSLVFVAFDQRLVGAVELHPTIRPEAVGIIAGLHQAGVKTCIISGDHHKPTSALARQLGIDDYFAETLPEDKANIIAGLQAQGKRVGFVGDGINDAIALKQANVSISMRGATTAATDTAQIILMDETLSSLDDLFALSRGFETNMSRNFTTTIVPGFVIIGGAFTGLVAYSSAIAIFFVGLGAGVVNTMWPRAKLYRELAMARVSQAEAQDEVEVDAGEVVVSSPAETPADAGFIPVQQTS